MAPDSSSTPRRRTKRVSAQHTQERVRNNQRRHRARRKDHIATLEEKIGEAEQTISTLRDQVEALQATLTQCCHQDGTSPPPLTHTDGEAAQEYGALSNTEGLGAWELASTEPLVPDGQPGSEVNSLISSPHDISQALLPTAQSFEFGPEYPLVAESASNQAVAETGSLLPATIIQNHISNTTAPCCATDLSSNSQSTVYATNRMALVLSEETPLRMPAYVLQPAMEASYQAIPYGESTIPCSEAYMLIAQQNFKGMSRRDVAAWLWHGFRRSLQPGEGCRVQTDMIFSLLVFISDS